MSTRISIDGYEPKHLSYSTVNGYRFCPKSFQLGKIKRVEQRPGWAAIGGNAVHRATELLDLAAFERSQVDTYQDEEPASGDAALRDGLRSWGLDIDQ
ncbi:hypothetical protein [Nocardioides massiliensis]|uniref:PD-(D/E)XK endonuclease-like domain-containing protein n=1 Tax=Nocardioides massiliensis TaxID=1325935 RepID=A0ABT9NJB1_9ACTN|nr:hypothetical protein [Nocardioides massiliensis]MDP9820497.1 hypothetical protein [Nocardioides massiliensis]